MKIKTIVSILLLFVMSLSFVSEHILTSYTNYTSEICTTTTLHESVFDTPQMIVDTHCEIHCEYHSSYVQPEYNIFTVLDTKNTLRFFSNNSYLLKTYLKISKPPIT
ncbi:MAG: hypothetical protein L3J10_09950 [Sulfurimonas sp.]|nr:hypothetical protein [Sulfurimonas sp.]